MTDIVVELERDQLVRLLFSNNWRSLGTVEELAAAISAAIREQLPQVEPASDTAPQRPKLRELSQRERREHMAMHRDYMRRSREFAKRALAANAIGEAQAPEQEDGKNVIIRFANGQFHEVLINPQWAEKSTANTIAEAVLEAFSGVDLVSTSPMSEDLTALRQERAKIREFVQA